MRIKDIEKSADLCAENGWTAYYLHLESPLDRDSIDILKKLGNCTFLEHLKKPFFSVNSKDFILKGFLESREIKIGINQHNQYRLETIIHSIDPSYEFRS